MVIIYLSVIQMKWQRCLVRCVPNSEEIFQNTGNFLAWQSSRLVVTSAAACLSRSQNPCSLLPEAFFWTFSVLFLLNGILHLNFKKMYRSEWLVKRNNILLFRHRYILVCSYHCGLIKDRKTPRVRTCDFYF